MMYKKEGTEISQNMNSACGVEKLKKGFFAQISSICSRSDVEKWITQKEGAGNSSTLLL